QRDLEWAFVDANTLLEAERHRQTLDEPWVDRREGVEEVPLPGNAILPPNLGIRASRHQAVVDQVPRPPLADGFGGSEHQEPDDGETPVARLAVPSVAAACFEEALGLVAVAHRGGVLGLVPPAVARERVAVQ